MSTKKERAELFSVLSEILDNIENSPEWVFVIKGVMSAIFLMVFGFYLSFYIPIRYVITKIVNIFK